MNRVTKLFHCVLVEEYKDGREYARYEGTVPSIRKPSKYVRENSIKKMTFSYYETYDEAKKAVEAVMGGLAYLTMKEVR